MLLPVISPACLHQGRLARIEKTKRADRYGALMPLHLWLVRKLYVIGSSLLFLALSSSLRCTCRFTKCDIDAFCP